MLSAAYSQQGMLVQLQEKFCLATAYKDAKLSRCTSCSRRNGMDTCRFRDVRFILRDAAGACRGIGFKSKSAATLERVDFPHSWNTDLRKEHLSTIKVRIMWTIFSPHRSPRTKAGDCYRTPSDTSKGSRAFGTGGYHLSASRG